MKTWRDVVVILLLLAANAKAGVKVASVFGDHMVLQRQAAVPLWGTAAPGEKVTVAIAEQTVSTAADEQGAWRVRLAAMQAGGPYRMSIQGKGQKAIELEDVLVGEVWVCSGQSNMEWPTHAAVNGEQEVSSANWPKIRLFKVPTAGSATPLTQVKAQWQVCSPKAVRDFSAVGYFFGRELHQHLDVPVGMIESAVGGTPAESWTPREALLGEPSLVPIVESLDKMLAAYPQTKAEYDKKAAEWESKYGDVVDESKVDEWASAKVDEAEVHTMKLPQAWQAAGVKGNGVVWFYKEIKVPDGWAGKELSLELGQVDDWDRTYFNGKKVGSVGKGNPWAPLVARKYKIAGELVRPGSNVITVRVYDLGGNGGLTGKPEQMKLTLADGSGEAISLAGEWRYRIERLLEIPPRPAEPPGPGNAFTASALWNAMVNPLVPYGIRGAIWYQGESNAPKAMQYRTLFPTMIKGWRTAWGADEFPFLFVQLANFSNWKPPATQPRDSTWAELREAQTMTLTLANTGMASAIDIGESNDIHPKNKQEVSRRLGLVARATVYGEDVAYRGPMYESMAVDASAIRVRMKFADELKARDGAAPKGFSIAGADRKFVWADAKIDGQTIVVNSAAVAAPVAVRYAWDDDPQVNVCNGAGLPLIPFRTDDW